MKSAGLALLIMLMAAGLQAQEAQWRGPKRTGIFPDKGLLKEWPDSGPELMLKVDDLGGGYSSPVYHEGIIYITGKKGDTDYLSAVDMNGNIVYQVPYGKAWDQSYPESRSTPTLNKGKIYLISGLGEVVCINATNGEMLWKVNAHEKYQGELHRWGVAESPLVVDDKVIYTTGGDIASLVAFNKDSGKEEWKTGSTGDPRAFVSPILYEHNGVRAIIAVTAEYILGISPDNGEIMMKYTFLPENAGSMRGATNNTNTPVIHENEIFVSKGYDQFGVKLRVSDDGKSFEELWKTEVLDTHHGHYVLVNNFLFGSNWLNNSKGNWVCLDWETGEVMYEDEWITKGSIAFADNLLYCYEERSGNVALVNPIPQKFDVISSFEIEEGFGPHWAHPYISDGKLLIRHGDVLMVFNIKNRS